MDWLDLIDTVICGDARSVLLTIPDGVIQACITSPPYWGLRDFGLDPTILDGDSECQHQWEKEATRIAFQNNLGNNSTLDRSGIVRGSSVKISGFCHKCGAWMGCLGLEPTPELYIEHLVQIFREVKRVLRDDGTLWLNIADSYFGGGNSRGNNSPISAIQASNKGATGQCQEHAKNIGKHPILKPKDMCLIPFRLAIALQRDGWWVRSTIIWHKPNCMPSSVKDRTTNDFEYVFLMSKNRKYYYDQEAIREPYTEPLNRWGGDSIKEETAKHSKYLEIQNVGVSSAMRADRKIRPNEDGKNKRSVWTIPTTAFPGAHFATFPPKLIEPMILAGSSDKVCPYCGSAWKRIVERSGGSIGKGWTDHRNDFEQGISASKCNYENYKVRTVGLEASCDCSDNDGSEQSIILDPFGGSGTTGAVAKRLNRHYLIMEPNASYCKLADKRIADVKCQLTLQI